jgi:hypothetical protein
MIIALMLGRAHSTGFPGKNTFPILGRPLMVYPLLAAQRANLVDSVFVSTDSPEIKEITLAYGANIIDRPPEYCSDSALAEESFLYSYRCAQRICAAEIELVVLLMCNAATILPEMIDKGIQVLREDPSLDSAVSVSRYNMWSPLRARKIGEDGLLHPFVPLETVGDPSSLSSSRDSQDDSYFADMGVSIVRPQCLERWRDGQLPQRWMGQRIYPLVQWGGLDIDYEWQLPLVEFWLKQHGFSDVDACSSTVTQISSVTVS